MVYKFKVSIVRGMEVSCTGKNKQSYRKGSLIDEMYNCICRPEEFIFENEEEARKSFSTLKASLPKVELCRGFAGNKFWRGDVIELSRWIDEEDDCELVFDEAYFVDIDESVYVEESDEEYEEDDD